jgi:hypothetical protein
MAGRNGFKPGLVVIPAIVWIAKAHLWLFRHEITVALVLCILSLPVSPRRSWPHPSVTTRHGVATIRLVTGRYTVFSTYCGTQPHHVSLAAGHVTHVQIVCPIP